MAASTLKPGAEHPVGGALSPVVFVVGFAVFLVIALIAQMLTMRWRTWLPGAESEKSMIGGVKAAVHTFMSHIP